MSDKESCDLGYLVMEGCFYPGFYNYQTIERYLIDSLSTVIDDKFINNEKLFEVEQLDGAPSFCWSKTELVEYFEKNGLNIGLLELKKAQVGRLKIHVSVEFEPICEVEEKEIVITTVEKKVEIKEL